MLFYWEYQGTMSSMSDGVWCWISGYVAEAEAVGELHNQMMMMMGVG